VAGSCIVAGQRSHMCSTPCSRHSARKTDPGNHRCVRAPCCGRDVSAAADVEVLLEPDLSWRQQLDQGKKTCYLLISARDSSIRRIIGCVVISATSDCAASRASLLLPTAILLKWLHAVAGFCRAQLCQSAA